MPDLESADNLPRSVGQYLATEETGQSTSPDNVIDQSETVLEEPVAKVATLRTLAFQADLARQMTLQTQSDSDNQGT